MHVHHIFKFLRYSSTAERDIYRNIENNGRGWGGEGGGKESGSHDGFKVQGPWLGGALRYSGRGWTERGVGGGGEEGALKKRGIN